jgi:hypothetical protein
MISSGSRGARGDAANPALHVGVRVAVIGSNQRPLLVDWQFTAYAAPHLTPNLWFGVMSWDSSGTHVVSPPNKNRKRSGPAVMRGLVLDRRGRGR